MSANKAILLGRLGKDPELTFTTDGKGICKFGLATSKSWEKDGEKQEKTTWHNIVAWGKVAEVMAECLGKGREVYIEGRIENRTYDDKDGNKRYISEVVVQNFSFVGSKADAGSKPTLPGSKPTLHGTSDQDDDLPF